MGMPTNIVIADSDEIKAIAESSAPAQEWRGLELPGLDPQKIAMLHCILTGESFDEAAAQYDPIYAGSGEGPWVIAVPHAPVEKLARLEEQVMEQVGEEWAASEDLEREHWPVEEVQAVVAELAALASISIAQEKKMFIWIAA
jgi:hypothetical protein